MKILFFTESLRSGGKERRMCELIKGLNREGHTVELVITENEIHYRDILEINIKIHILKRKFFKKDPTIFFRFFKIANTFKPNIIHTWGTMTSFYSIPAKLLLRIPLINSEIADTKPIGQKLFRDINFIFSDKIVSNTQAGLKAYNAPKNKSLVIYNGFDFRRVENLITAQSVREKFKISTKYVVAMVGTFYPQKDYDTYIKAAKLITEKRKNICFLCIGSGDSSKFERSCKNNNQILFLGKQSNVESIMKICDVGVLTTNSKIHGEGISNALLEFCSLEVPVVATNFGGTPELIEEGVNGYLIDSFDSADLALKIENIVKDHLLRINMGSAGIRIVKNKFTIYKMLEDFLKEYKDLYNPKGIYF